MHSTVWTNQRCSRSYTEKRREEGGDIGGQEDNRRESKGERQIQPVISSLSVLHRLEHTKRFTELGREEKGEGGDRGDLREKKESQKGKRAIKPVITLLSKMGTEDCILKGTKLVTNTKEQILKIWSRG